MRHRARWLGLAIVIGTAIAVGLLISTRPTEEFVPRTLPPVHVRTTLVEAADVEPTRWLSGTLEPVRRARLHFEIAGPVIARHVEAGDEVAAGDALLAIDDGDLRDALNEAEARLAQEQANIARDHARLEFVTANLRLQAREVERLRHLHEGELASGSQLEVSQQKLLQLRVDEASLRAAVDTSEARLTLARKAVSRARRNLARSVLRAPFVGTINHVGLEIGDHATPSTEAVEIVDRSAFNLRLAVSVDMARHLFPGQQIEVAIVGRRLMGTIRSIQAAPDPRTATYPVRILLPDKGLVAGQTGRAHLPLGRIENALMVPVTALLHDEGQTYLFVVNGERLERRAVDTGPRINDRQVVRGGIAAGERIVSESVAALSPGQHVAIAAP